MVLWKWIKWVAYYLIIISLLLAIAGTSYQLVKEYQDDRRYPPPGKLVEVADHKLHYQIMGEGSPTVILDAGVGESSIDWALVQPEIAKFTRVFSYDRAGYGWSDEVAEKLTGWEVVDDLNTLLEREHIEPPYVLVGHSLGAAYMRLYTSQYPEKVAGLVLVDPEEQSEQEVSEPSKEMVKPDPEIVLMMSQMGLRRLLLDSTGWAPQGFPSNIQKVWIAKQAATKQTRAALIESESEEDVLDELDPIELEVGDRPLIVITPGKLPDFSSLNLSKEWSNYYEKRFEKRKELHTEMVSKVPNGKQMFAEDSDHMVLWNQPQIIVEAVKEVVEEVREGH